MRYDSIHNLGCSIIEISALFDPAMGENDPIFPYTVRGKKQLKKELQNTGSGLAIWTDVVTYKGYFDHYTNTFGPDYPNNAKYSGEKFYEGLKSRGEHVRKTKPFLNPGSGNLIVLYSWEFNRPAKAVGRKKVVKKA